MKTPVSHGVFVLIGTTLTLLFLFVVIALAGGFATG